jgi:beta-alanine degradation protein BauB
VLIVLSTEDVPSQSTGGIHMKAKPAMAGTAVFIAIAAIGASPSYAIDFVEAAPKQAKVLVDNDKVRIIEVTLQKGDKIPMHTHPDSVVHVIKGGRVKWTLADGKTMESKAKDGDTMFRPAVTHAHEHIDASHAILIELKK